MNDQPPAVPPRGPRRRNPFALVLLVVAIVTLLVGAGFTIAALLVEHVARPTDAVSGAALQAASEPWLFVGAVALLLWIAVAAIRWQPGR